MKINKLKASEPKVNEAQRTQTPWKYQKLASQPKEALLIFRDRSLQMPLEDAELIVRAVNSHEALLNRARCMHGELHARAGSVCDSKCPDRKAIAKAEETI